MELQEAAKANEFFDEVENFSHQTRMLEEHYSSEMLEQFGADFTDQAGCFDIDKMNITLKAYPEKVASFMEAGKQFIYEQWNGFCKPSGTVYSSCSTA